MTAAHEHSDEVSSSRERMVATVRRTAAVVVVLALVVFVFASVRTGADQERLEGFIADCEDDSLIIEVETFSRAGFSSVRCYRTRGDVDPYGWGRDLPRGPLVREASVDWWPDGWPSF